MRAPSTGPLLNTLLPVLALGLLVAAPAGSSTASTVRWEMDEPGGARTMRDATGGGVVGAVGDDVRTGVPQLGATGFRFRDVAPDAPPVRPGHTVVVGDHPRLDPAGRVFTVDVRLRTTAKGGNVVQKGQARTAGGFWKLELNAGEPTCVFRGGNGVTNAVRARGRDISDGQWHTVRCRATRDEVRLWVDGTAVGRNTGWTGSIANGSPLSIGGKQSCDQRSVGCDYFGGHIDHVRVTAS